MVFQEPGRVAHSEQVGLDKIATQDALGAGVADDLEHVVAGHGAGDDGGGGAPGCAITDGGSRGRRHSRTGNIGGGVLGWCGMRRRAAEAGACAGGTE
uniref:Uncharacterized protein n=1 Tax=Arundo donax TaxID=35708 RepID=A0A0A8ZDL2_ARUDO